MIKYRVISATNFSAHVDLSNIFQVKWCDNWTIFDLMSSWGMPQPIFCPFLDDDEQFFCDGADPVLRYFFTFFRILGCPHIYKKSDFPCTIIRLTLSKSHSYFLPFLMDPNFLNSDFFGTKSTLHPTFFHQILPPPDLRFGSGPARNCHNRPTDQWNPVNCNFKK